MGPVVESKGSGVRSYFRFLGTFQKMDNLGGENRIDSTYLRVLVRNADVAIPGKPPKLQTQAGFPVGPPTTYRNSALSFISPATCRLLSTLKTPGTMLARIPAIAISASLLTTPIKVTLPFSTMMRIA